ncbi:unnamed protein product [Caenorhabditis bovis]|uniref:Carbonic anhydrase n=1 Tax=Caenorhabditis bovis TaxID=2654633 RepID=A0A8S1EM20_9PELO|nr:unnamed protein product [Caenorhabditis bovis]
MRSSLIVAYFFSFIVGVIFGESSDEDWGYGENDGPETWRGQCQSNRRQSPVDITLRNIDLIPLPELNFINYDYPGNLEILNTGKTLIVTGFEKWKQRQPMLEGGALLHRYKLSQFHLHWGQNDYVGSEHAIESRYFPGELHLVHIREDLTLEEALSIPNSIAAVSVLTLTTNYDNQGKHFEPIADKLPLLQFSGNSTRLKKFKTNSILPFTTDSFYSYEGSLTTPNCEEVVIWTIVSEPIYITVSQMNELRKLRNSDGEIAEKNFRSLQPLNGRRILYKPSRWDRTYM